MRRGVLTTLLGIALLGLSACSDESDPEVAVDYASTRQAPENISVYPDDDESPGENALAQVRTESGSEVVAWVDPDDWRIVWQQHSDPDNAERWSEPERLFTAGEGCSGVFLGVAGNTVAGTVWCYGDDLFRQQAPDEAVAVATTDLVDWDRSAPQELITNVPQVREGSASWEGGALTWQAGEGFD